MAQWIRADGLVTDVRPASGSPEFQLEELQRMVGGYIEIVYLQTALLVVNEDGWALGLERNFKASGLAGQIILGDVVLCSRQEIS